jgi:drug/metabolite transporter (DMT)-like permease
VALPKSNAMATALEMMSASVVLIAIAIGRGELASWRPSQVTLPSALAMVYLIVFGSMVAFSAYAWLLQVCPPARVATYAYVNPVVALALGALMKHEPINLLTIEATIIILGAVALLSWRKKR